MKRLAFSLVLLAAFIFLSSCDTEDCRVESIVLGDIPVSTVDNYFEHTFGYTRNCSPEKENWYLLGPLPPGLQFSSNGVLSGVPTKAGDYDITIEIECFFDEEYDQWDNPIYTDRSTVSTTFTFTVLESSVR